MQEQKRDQAEQYTTIVQALREAGYKFVTEADVESVCQQMRLGKKPTGIVGQVITEHLRRQVQGAD